MPPAARVGDQHACPAHGGGPVTAGSATVKIGGQPAARVGDQSSCGAARDTIIQGAPTVFIEGKPAARAGDRCAHAGVIVTGWPTVIIGNDGAGTTKAGAGGGTGLTGAGSGADGAASSVSGTKVSSQVVSAIAKLARQFAGTPGALAGADDPGLLQSLATMLEVALARGDAAGVGVAITKIQDLMQRGGPKAEAAAEGATTSGPERPVTGWQKGPPSAADPIRSVAVNEGRLVVNGHVSGLHAISEFDLIALHAAGRIEQVIQRIETAAAAGRNCARVFCMYRNPLGELSPWATPGYWTNLDAVVTRLAAQGMFAELVLLADCEARGDGSGGVMPAWNDRRAFLRDAGRVLKGKPVIVCGMDEPGRNGAAGADDPRLLAAMREFNDASGGTVPFSVGDPAWDRDEDLPAIAVIERALVGDGARFAVVHAPRKAEDRRYRAWIDRLARFDRARGPDLDRRACFYHNKPMGFGSGRGATRRETDPEAAVAAAAVCAVHHMGFCYHRMAADDPATPGLELARVATMIPQSPDYTPFLPGPDAPIVQFDPADFPGGDIFGCTNGAEAWAVGYGTKLPSRPRMTWNAGRPDVIWRGERVVIWRRG